MGDEEEILSTWILKHLSTGNVIRLKIGELKVGRSPSCDIMLVSSLVSKQHCNLFVSEKRVILTDFSSNGVFVNTNKYNNTTTVIEKDDRIGFGCETCNEDCLNDPDRYPIFYLKHDPIQENNETNSGNKIEQNQEIEQTKGIDSGHQEIAENMEKFNQNKNNVKERKPIIIEISDSSDEDSDSNYDKPKSIVNKSDNLSISRKSLEPSSCDSLSTTNSDKHNHVADKSDGATDSLKCITNHRKSTKEVVNQDCIQNSVTSKSLSCDIHAESITDEQKRIVGISDGATESSNCNIDPKSNSDKQKQIVEKSESPTESSKCIANRRKSTNEKTNHDSGRSIKSGSSTCNIDPKSNSDKQKQIVDKSDLATESSNRQKSTNEKTNHDSRRSSIKSESSNCNIDPKYNSDKQKQIVDKSESPTESSKCIANRRKSTNEKTNHDSGRSIKSGSSTCKIDPKFNSDKQKQIVEKSESPTESSKCIRTRRKSTNVISECSDVINDERMPTIVDAMDQINPISDLNEIKNDNYYEDDYDNIDVEFSQSILHEIKQEVLDLENEESVIDDCGNNKFDRSEDEKVTNDNDEQYAVSPLFNEECDYDDEEERDIEQCALKWLEKLSQSQTISEKKEMIQKQQSSVIENEKIQKRKVPEIIEAPSLPTTKGKLRGISAEPVNKLKRKLQDNLPAVQSKIKRTEQEAELKRKWHQKPSVIQRKKKEANEKLKQDRKDKLKQLAKNQKNKRKSSDDDDVKVLMKPKVKVTLKNRGAFLTEEQPSKSKISPSKVSIIERKNVSNNNKMHNHNTIEKKPSDVSDVKSNGNYSNLTNNLKSIIRKPNSPSRKTNLHVRFNDSPDIKYYLIEDDSNMNVKINNKIKDAPTPDSFENIIKLNDRNKITQLHKINQAKRRNRMQIIDNFNEILSEVLNWNPNWLETGKHEIIGAGQILLPILHAFSSFDEFRRTLFPLMKLEFWASIEHDYKNRKLDKKPYLYENLKLLDSSLEYKDKTITFLCLYYVNNSTVKKIIFNIGDLCLMKISDQIYFAYIRGVYKKHFNLNDTHYEIVLEAAKNPNLIKLLSIKNQKIQLKSITIIKVELSSFNAIYSLKYSPLMNNVINPLENIKLKDLKTDNICYKGRDSLNDNQKCALLKTYLRCIDYDNPSISLIQGPPGTGKSRVIANLAMQLLYGREVGMLQNKILICSQSNAAIDVICLKLLHIRKNMTIDKFNLLRFGILDRMHPRVQSISVQKLIEKHNESKLPNMNDVNSSLNKEKLFLEEKIANLKKMPNLHDNINSDKLQEAIKNLQKIEKLQNNQLSPADEIQEYTRFLNGANIVCTTLSSAIKLLQHTKYFDVCIIDEATQCTEQLSLMPLQFGISSLVLVGDTQQLPATVISKKANEYGLGRSLFTRIQSCIEGKNNNSCLLTLTEQYRMHPEISHWPNAYFYNGMLTNAPETLTNHLNIKPYMLYNLKNDQNSSITNGQIYNNEEATFIIDLIKGIIPLFPLNKYEFGVITPYAMQRDKIRYELRKEFNNVGIMVDTIDSFQGKEKDVIIISMARTKGIGFLAHPQRLNVALTRAKKCLMVCGNFTNIERIPAWKSLIEDARKRNVIFDVKENVDVQKEVIPLLKL